MSVAAARQAEMQGSVYTFKSTRQLSEACLLQESVWTHRFQLFDFKKTIEREERSVNHFGELA
jgi:hypothetical protein